MPIQMGGNGKARLAKLEADMNGINDDAMQDLSENLAEEALVLVALGFRLSRDPYGKSWKGKLISDGRPPLSGRTARLRRGWHRKWANASGFSIGPAVSYAGYHQTGTGIHGPKRRPIKPKRAKMLRWQAGGTTYFARSVQGVVPRKMVPDGDLPPEWEDALVEAAHAFFGERLK